MSAGEDYAQLSGTLHLAIGQTTKTIPVTVFDDAHDEGEETLTLTLSNADGAYIADAKATGTIENTDPMPKAWTMRFARTVGGQIVNALNERFARGNASQITVGGLTFPSIAGKAPERTIEDPFALPETVHARSLEEEAQTLTAQDLRTKSAFHLSSRLGAAQGAGPQWSAWGKTAFTAFKGSEDDVAIEGDVTTGLLGIDAQWNDALGGVMLSHSEGEGSYDLEESDDGTVESALTGIYPYARMGLNEKVSAWALAGLGTGRLMLERKDGEPIETDTSMRLGALGIEGAMLDAATHGLTMNVRSDAMWVHTESERTTELIATRGDATRLRLIARAQRAFALPGEAQLTPSMEMGIRHDGGDAERGIGLEVGTALQYTQGRLSIAGQARALIAHETAVYEEWGASANIAITPRESGRGLTLRVAPSFGRTESTREQLWGAADAPAFTRSAETFIGEGSVAAELGYGFAHGQQRSVITPYTGLSLGANAKREIRIGAKWRLGANAAASIEATRKHAAGSARDDALSVQATVRF